MALALYRRYRPKVFEDLLGQESIVDVLRNAARLDKIAHAYLFYGPRGTGKTTTARLIAKIANCEKRATDKKFKEKGEPCNECRQCTEIDENRALDVIEIDAASNRGIDEMRNLKETVRLSPTSYRYKVFIIDETHMLTKEAFNALLKTLEEPPAHVIFILATSEYDKIPATITSRTQRFHFRKLPLDAIVEKLKTIVKAEKLKVKDDALELIASAAEGSFRDAESLLDQLTSLEENVTLETVERIIGKTGMRKVSEFAGIVLEGDLKRALTYLTELNGQGYNMVDFTKELIQYIRRATSLHFDPTLTKLFEKEITRDELTTLETHSKKIKPDIHIPLLKTLIRAYSEMRYSPLALIPLEVAVIESLSQKQ